MSSRELERVEVMGRVGSEDLKLSDAAVMLELSYRQTKRLWRQYREVGRKGLKHGNAGRPSNRSKPARFRRRVLNLIKENIPVRKRKDSGRPWQLSTWPKKMAWCWITTPYDFGCCRTVCGAGNEGAKNIASEGNANRTLANWYSWTGVSMIGWKGVVRVAV